MLTAINTKLLIAIVSLLGVIACTLLAISHKQDAQYRHQLEYESAAHRVEFKTHTPAQTRALDSTFGSGKTELPR